ncbi:unnamed protein product [Strongylus vulgaris]|uniref:Uncharacterized protein n=1 Tax=Strongylus vulgaris TaxID=40348 RepID=A0A3P7JRA6_STRVU|nr:unnamed protein product [Strongylus vulgaris]
MSLRQLTAGTQRNERCLRGSRIPKRSRILKLLRSTLNREERGRDTDESQQRQGNTIDLK